MDFSVPELEALFYHWKQYADVMYQQMNDKNCNGQRRFIRSGIFAG